MRSLPISDCRSRSSVRPGPRRTLTAVAGPRPCRSTTSPGLALRTRARRSL